MRRRTRPTVETLEKRDVPALSSLAHVAVAPTLSPSFAAMQPAARVAVAAAVTAPNHAAADRAADYYESQAVHTGNYSHYLAKGFAALLAQDHPVVGFFRLQYYYANYAHDFNSARNCYEWAIHNAAYWANYDPHVKGSGSDRHYGIWDGIFEADAYFDHRFDNSTARSYRDYAHSLTASWQKTPITSTIAGWWHFGTGQGWAYVKPLSATKVTMSFYDGPTFKTSVTLDRTSGNQDYGIFYHAYNTSLTNAISFTFDDRDSAHMSGLYTSGGSRTNLLWTRWYA